MHKVIILGFPLVFVFLSAKVIGDEILRGKCERVLDGDTIEINKKRIRLWGIDAPEVSQKSFEGKEIGLISKAFLSQLIEGKEIKVVITHRGYYGRMIGKIYVGKKFINFEMIKSVTIKNFMAHSNLSLDDIPDINIIIGKNSFFALLVNNFMVIG